MTIDELGPAFTMHPPDYFIKILMPTEYPNVELPKMSDSAKLCYLRLATLAARLNAEGFLAIEEGPLTTQVLAILLRTRHTRLKSSLNELIEGGLVQRIRNVYYLPHCIDISFLPSIPPSLSDTPFES